MHAAKYIYMVIIIIIIIVRKTTARFWSALFFTGYKQVKKAFPVKFLTIVIFDHEMEIRKAF
jgi:hypothetical protein